MLRDLFSTNSDWTLTIIRTILGVVFFAHGAQKVFGWFGLRGLIGYFKQSLGSPLRSPYWPRLRNSLEGWP